MAFENEVIHGYELMASQTLLISAVAILFGPVIIWEEKRDFSFNDLECELYKGDSLLVIDNFCGMTLGEYDELTGRGNFLFIGKVIFARTNSIVLYVFSMLNWVFTWIYPELQLSRAITLWIQQFLSISLLVNLESFLQTSDVDTYSFSNLRTRNINYVCALYMFFMTSFFIGLYFYRFRTRGNIYK